MPSYVDVAAPLCLDVADSCKRTSMFHSRAEACFQARSTLRASAGFCGMQRETPGTFLEGAPTTESELHQHDERFLEELRARPRTAQDASSDAVVEALAQWRRVARCSEASLGDGEVGFRAAACECRRQAVAAERRGQELDLRIALKWRELAERYERLVTPLSRSG